MEDSTVRALLVGYAIIVLGFVFIVARNPVTWGTAPGRFAVWFVVGLIVAGPLGALFVLMVARHHRNATSLSPPPDV